MSVNRVLRYLVGLIIASVLLYFGLPLVGMPPSKFLPPPIVYNNAQGKATGVVLGKEVAPSANPFRVGDHIYLVNYAFRAPPPLSRGETKPGPTVRYYGSSRVPDEATYNLVKADQHVPVKYEATYPDINGINLPTASRSVGAGSNILSGWLLFVLLDFFLAYFFMTILERFGRKEDL